MCLWSEAGRLRRWAWERMAVPVAGGASWHLVFAPAGSETWFVSSCRTNQPESPWKSPMSRIWHAFSSVSSVTWEVMAMSRWNQVNLSAVHLCLVSYLICLGVWSVTKTFFKCHEALWNANYLDFVVFGIWIFHCLIWPYKKDIKIVGQENIFKGPIHCCPIEI